MIKYANRIVLTHQKIWDIWFSEPIGQRIRLTNDKIFLYYFCISKLVTNLIKSDNFCLRK